LFTALYYILPNFSHFNFITPAGHGQEPPLAMIGGGIVYAVLYSAVLLAAATLIFNRRNFK
jgi:ABC-type transport system involved in multi-copper enzyme maturation permease subunit